MNWVAPLGKDNTTAALEKRLWTAADQLRANSELKSSAITIANQIQNLRRTCDLLLPRLLSGQVNLNTKEL